MYRIENRSEAIKDLQKNLANLEKNNVYVAPSGIYDENTKEAVSDFQTRESLDVTGVADFKTQTMIYERSIEDRRRESIKKANPNINFPLSLRDTGYEIARINQILNEVLVFYGHYIIERESRIYSERTEQAVNILKEIFGYSESEGIDELFYERLMLEYSDISKLKE